MSPETVLIWYYRKNIEIHLLTPLPSGRWGYNGSHLLIVLYLLAFVAGDITLRIPGSEPGTQRIRETASHVAHNHKIVGSTPTSATKHPSGCFFYAIFVLVIIASGWVAGKYRGYTLKPIIAELSESHSKIKIYPIGDVHLGSPECQIGKVKTLIKEIENQDNAYVVLMGDICDNATKTSVSDSYSAKLSPMEQIKQASELFEPIKEKILAVVTGNHCFRSYKTDGIDIMRLICRQLGIEEQYRPESAAVFVSFGQRSRKASLGRKQKYLLYASHGTGGGRKVGGKANRLSDMSNIIDADVFFIAHTHQPIVFKDSVFRVTRSSNGLEMVERTYINCNGWLGYGGYGEQYGFQPPSLSAPVVVLSGTERSISAKI